MKPTGIAVAGLVLTAFTASAELNAVVTPLYPTKPHDPLFKMKVTHITHHNGRTTITERSMISEGFAGADSAFDFEKKRARHHTTHTTLTRTIPTVATTDFALLGGVNDDADDADDGDDVKNEFDTAHTTLSNIRGQCEEYDPNFVSDYVPDETPIDWAAISELMGAHSSSTMQFGFGNNPFGNPFGNSFGNSFGNPWGNGFNNNGFNNNPFNRNGFGNHHGGHHHHGFDDDHDDGFDHDHDHSGGFGNTRGPFGNNNGGFFGDFFDNLTNRNNNHNNRNNNHNRNRNNNNNHNNNNNNRNINRNPTSQPDTVVDVPVGTAPSVDFGFDDVDLNAVSPDSNTITDRLERDRLRNEHTNGWNSGSGSILAGNANNPNLRNP